MTSKDSKQSHAMIFSHSPSHCSLSAGEWGLRAALKHHFQLTLSALSAVLEPDREKTQVVTRQSRFAYV